MEIEHNALLIFFSFFFFFFFISPKCLFKHEVGTCHAFEHVQKENGEAKITVMKLSDLQLRF